MVIFHGRSFLPAEGVSQPSRAGTGCPGWAGPSCHADRKWCVLCLPSPQYNNRGVHSPSASLTTKGSRVCSWRLPGKHCLVTGQHSRPGSQDSGSRSRVEPGNPNSSQLSQKWPKDVSGPKSSLWGGRPGGSVTCSELKNRCLQELGQTGYPGPDQCSASPGSHGGAQGLPSPRPSALAGTRMT